MSSDWTIEPTAGYTAGNGGLILNAHARCLVVLAWGIALFPAPAGGDQTPGGSESAAIIGDFAVWDPSVPLPPPDSLAYPSGAVDVVVHRADEEYRFLHDNAIMWHGDTLFAAWYNCPSGEIQGASCIRSRRSHDAGKTWSQVEVIAADTRGDGTFYVPVTFLSNDGQLLAYVANMVGHDLVTGCEVFIFDPASDRWASHGHIAGPFLPNCPPLLMDDGNFIMAGRMANQRATTPEIPAVALSSGKNVADPWQVVPMMAGKSTKPHTDYPESTVWLDGANVTAVTRGGLVFTSADFGRTWRGPLRHNLPAERQQAFRAAAQHGATLPAMELPEITGHEPPIADHRGGPAQRTDARGDVEGSRRLFGDVAGGAGMVVSLRGRARRLALCHLHLREEAQRHDHHPAKRAARGPGVTARETVLRQYSRCFRRCW